MRAEQRKSQTPNYFDAITVRIASPEQIKAWAKKTACHCPPGKSQSCTCGEVKKPETINYRTFRPEPEGLFCEAIFGPQKDWECACGKYKRIKHKGVVCDRCGVEVTRKEVRRERMGYIDLVAPVSHIWFFKGLPSRIGLILDISHRDLEKILYFESYIVLDPKDSPLEKMQLLSENEYDHHRKMGSGLLFLFEAGTQGIGDDLDRGVIPEDLWQKFRSNKIGLSQSATALSEEEGRKERKWLIKDNDKTYSVREATNGAISVYEQRLLFSVNLVLFSIESISTGQVSRNLRKEFENNGCQLSQDAAVLLDERTSSIGRQVFRIIAAPIKRGLKGGEEGGKEEGGKREYTVIKEEDRLDVYAGDVEHLLGDSKKGSVSEELRRKFETNGFPLSKNATISVEDTRHETQDMRHETQDSPGSRVSSLESTNRWLVKDKDRGRVYFVRKEAGSLNIYKEGYEFEAGMGAAVIKKLLVAIDVEAEIASLRKELEETQSKQKEKKLTKRLKLLTAIQKSGNRPEWMVLNVVPVIPPELRPLVPLDGGRFATSDLNDLYRRVINRNNRLKRLTDLKAPEVIIRNEKRMLQEAVDALLDNGRHGRMVRGPGNRPLKSLSDMLRGKPGRFRQNLLGKRVDYSGRSVIVVGPELRMDQCGLPRKMALELFKPFIIRKLQEKGHATTIKSAKKMAEKATPEVLKALEEVITEHPVILNRAPTLHRLGIQAFQPILVEGKAIMIHPLVCQAFNADFDGDQMAVHIPLSTEAQIEAKILMMASQNILKPAHGHPIAVPDLDIVLGCNYLTKEKRGKEGEEGGRKETLRLFASADDMIIALQSIDPTKRVDLHTPVRFRIDRRNGTIIRTTPGRVIFNQIIPKDLQFQDEETDQLISFYNKEVDVYDLADLVAMCYDKYGNRRTVEFLDALKDIGFKYATKAGISICMDDMVIPEDKIALVARAQGEVKDVISSYREGRISDGERYNRTISIWGRLKSELEESLFETLRRDSSEGGTPGFNSVNIMTDSGARSKKDAISQIAGMRGLMSKPSGEIIETPIFANLREGLTVLEYFISTHGARKGLADTAIKTASSGYLTRKLVDVAQDVMITGEDCGTLKGIVKTSLGSEDEPGALAEKLAGRIAVEDFLTPGTEEIIVRSNAEITKDIARRIETAGITKVRVRSPLTCELERGVCRRCYGADLSSWKLVNIGEAIGIIAAQSIGEPGTQLTMRTFHTGGAVSGVEEQSKVEAKTNGTVKYDNVSTVARPDNTLAVTNRNGEIAVIDEIGVERERHSAIYGATLTVTDGGKIGKGELLMEWDPHNVPILTEVGGRVKFEDIVEGVTMREEIDESTGLAARVIIEHKDENLHAGVAIVDDNVSNKSLERARYDMSTGVHLSIHDGDVVSPGDVLARIPREISKAKDIVLGLPRVTELFEARKPRDCANISDIDGCVRFAGVSRGTRILKVVNPNGMEREYRIPRGKHLIVRDGDWVSAGNRLTDGPVNPHDILSVLGESEVQAYLVDEVQEVYRAAGEHINDKHIEAIVSQMLRKVRIVSSGDTHFLVGDEVDRVIFRKENQRVIENSSGVAATAEPILQGITKASLSTESFISAASFQQTTNVLTSAAISGKRDALRGIKENVIMGHLIPAGSGAPQYRQIGAHEALPAVMSDE